MRRNILPVRKDTLWREAVGSPLMRPFCQGDTCLRDEDEGDCLVLRELDQKFYYWSVLGGASRKLRGEKNGIPGRQRIYFPF